MDQEREKLASDTAERLTFLLIGLVLDLDRARAEYHPIVRAALEQWGDLRAEQVRRETVDPKGLSYAPWTDRQVAALNLYQQSGAFHPFTCGTEGCGHDLVAIREGWDCRRCHRHSQKWAHNFMVSYTAEDHPLRRAFAASQGGT